MRTGRVPRQSRQRLHNHRPSRSAGCSQGRRSRGVARVTLDGGRRGGYCHSELTRTFADLTACQIEYQLLQFTIALAAYNLVRIRNLLSAPT